MLTGLAQQSREKATAAQPRDRNTTPRMCWLLTRIAPGPRADVAVGERTVASELPGTGLPAMVRGEKEKATHGDLRIGLQREGRELCLLLVGASDGNAVLRPDAQRELLAAHRDTRDGLEAG